MRAMPISPDSQAESAREKARAGLSQRLDALSATNMGDTRRAWPFLSGYERFEQVVVLVVGALVSALILLALLHLAATVVALVVQSLAGASDFAMFQAVFGMVMTVLIALEFNHSIMGVLNRKRGIVQVRTVVLTKNVKDGFICLDRQMGEIGCDSAQAAIVLRIARRAVPDAGFAIKEPGIFLRQGYTAQTPRWTLALLEASHIDEVEPDAQAALRPSSQANPSSSRVGWLHPSSEDLSVNNDTYLQVTGSMHIAQWQLVGVEREGDQLKVRVRAMCQRVNQRRQAPFDEGKVGELEVRLDVSGSYDGVQVALCGGVDEVTGEVLRRLNAPSDGLWEEDPAFDWFVEQHEGRALIRLSTGTLLWNWSGSDEGGGDQSFRTLDIEAVWARFYP